MRTLLLSRLGTSCGKKMRQHFTCISEKETSTLNEDSEHVNATSIELERVQTSRPSRTDVHYFHSRNLIIPPPPSSLHPPSPNPSFFFKLDTRTFHNFSLKNGSILHLNSPNCLKTFPKINLT